MSDVITTIVRMHDPAGLRHLARALQSLHAQQGVTVDPLVVTQRFTAEQLAAVQATIRDEWFFSWQGTPTVVNYEGSLPDARSALANLGFRGHLERGNRYVALLDYDDLLYSDAYLQLIGRLRDSDSVIAFGGIEMLRVIPLHDYDFVYEVTHPFAGKNKLDLLRDNFCPLHSYVVDTRKLPADELYFREELTRVEDYDFLLRIAGKHPCDFACLDKYLGGYCMRSDGSNTTPNGSGTEVDKARTVVWEDNRKRLEALRSRYEVRFFASDF